MSAPLSQPLFHGSPHPFKVGDIVHPRKKGGASATSDPEFARQYAEGRGSVITAEMKKQGYAPRVFTVEPIGTTEPGRFGGKEVLSKKGFRITGEHKG